MLRLTVLSSIALATAAWGKSPHIELAAQGARVPYGAVQTYTFIPSAEAPSVHLVVSLRMDSPRCSGSTHSLRLSVNGKELTAGPNRSSLRLLNKPMTAVLASGLQLPWHDQRGWRVVYAPDFTAAASPVAGSMQVRDVSPYELVLDVTDLVVRGTENTLTVQHQGKTMKLRTYFPEFNPSLDFVLDALRVEFAAEPSKIVSSAGAETFDADRVMIAAPAPLAVTEVAVIDVGGGVTLKLPQLGVRLVSRFSRGDGGFNTLAPAGTARDASEWHVATSRTGDVTEIVAVDSRYRLERRVTWAGDHLAFEDRLSNLTENSIGLAFDNQLTTEPGAVVDAYLGGDPDPGLERSTRYENPTLFLAGAASGCGMVVLDDIYRIQGVIYYQNGGGIRSDTFALPARGTHTLRWAVYPLAKPDYYRFVNVLRARLAANFTVPGGFQFGLNDVVKMADEKLREMADVRDLRFISSGVWFDWGGDVKCYHGHHMLKATALRATLKGACAKVRRVLPEVKSLIYIHSFINTDPDSPGRFADSRVTLEGGGHYQNASYTKRIGIPFLYYYPTADNSYLAGMKEVIDMCLDPDEIGADGIYWDELDMMSQTRTFDRWDRCSAILDEKHRIRKTFGDVHLLARQGKVELIEYIRSKGGIVIANSAPTTATLAQVHFPRFVETAQRWYPARAHLYTPIALGDHHAIKTFPDLIADIRLKLMWGSLYYYYSRPPQPYPTITQHMFPFTPIQLHRGWLLGKERILTAVPGTFTFGDASPVRVYCYDAAGKITTKTGTERITEGRRLIRLPLARDEMAVIERK